jgi:tol-pal system protein YbgF
MTHPLLHLLRISVAAVALWTSAPAAIAQAAGDGSPGLFDGFFGGGERAAPSGRDRLAQAPGADLSMRIDRLEAQVRQMTGVIEQLQYRNQQLAEQLRQMQQGGEYANAAPQPSTQPPRAGGAPMGAPSPPPPAERRGDAFDPSQNPNAPGAPRTLGPNTGPAPNVGPGAGGGVPPQPPGRRGDAFDPTQNPNAPGAPRTLGSVPGNAVAVPGGPPGQLADEGSAPGGGREPLNIHSMYGNGAGDGALPPPRGMPPGTPPNGPQVATLPPSDSPRDYYDLAYGYVLRKDYPLAEDGFRAFLRKYPSDRMAPEAQYWLGESLFQQQRYRDAAEAFLNVSTKYESTAKAPDALLRLGTSLAALGEKEAACASLGEVMRKYPRAALGVKQGVEREQKRVGC